MPLVFVLSPALSPRDRGSVKTPDMRGKMRRAAADALFIGC